MMPLLDAKLSPARWNARQLLVNLSMTPDLLPTLKLYNVPNYVHGANVPGSHFERPYTASGDDLERVGGGRCSPVPLSSMRCPQNLFRSSPCQVPDHLADPRKQLHAARATSTLGGIKPPAMRTALDKYGPKAPSIVPVSG